MVVGLVENKQPPHYRHAQQGQQVYSATIPVQQPQHLVDAKILCQYNLVLQLEFELLGAAQVV
jgi:hypothetical protein